MSRFTIKEAARILDIHPNTVRAWVERGILRDVRIPGSSQIRLDRAQVERLAGLAGHLPRREQADGEAPRP